MGVFAPQQPGGIGFEQPVDPGAGGLGVAASVAKLFASNLSTPSTRTPTADERNGEYWSAWTEAQGLPGLTLGEATHGQLRAFSSFKPESADWAFKGAETQRSPALAELDLDMEIAEQNRKAFLVSPEGQLAQYKASSATDPESAQNILNISFGEFLTKQATIEEIKFQTEQTGWTNDQRKETWKVNEAGLQDQANVVSRVIYDSLDVLQLDPSATVEIPAGLRTIVPGLPATLTKDNAVRVAQQLREGFMTTMTNRIENEMGLDRGSLGGMDETTQKFVFSGLDTAITMLENGVKPDEIKKRMETGAYLELQSAGVPVEFLSTVSLAAAANTGLQQSLIAQLTGDMQGFMESGAIEDARRIAKEMSEKERTEAFAGFSELAKIYAGTSTVGQVYAEIDQTTRDMEFGKSTLAAAAAAEASGALLGDGFWESNVAAVSTKFDAASRADPSFAPEMTNHLTGDMNTRVVRVNEKIPGYKLAVDGSGKFSVVPDESTEREIAGYEQDIANLQSGAFVPVGGKEAVAGLIAGYTKEIERLRNPDLGEVSADINAIQKRWGILGQTGEIGQGVRTRLDADFQLSEAPKIAEEARAVLEESVKPGEIRVEPLGQDYSNMSASDLISVAETTLGWDENQQLDKLSAYMAGGGVDLDPSETAWCAGWLNATLSQVGLDGTGSLAARSFLNWGTEVSTPQLGDIVVLSRGDDPNAGHVGIFKGFDDNGDILILGGNQGDSVSVASFSKDRLLGYRRAPGVEAVEGEKAQQQVLAEVVYRAGTEAGFLPSVSSEPAPSTSSEGPEQPITPAVEAGVFTQTPGGRGENLRGDRTGGEVTRPLPPALEGLTPQELQELVDYVKSLGG